MRRAVSGFVKDESGAITVDWVVLTAAIVGLNMVILFAPAREGLVNLMVTIGETMGIVGDVMQDSNNLGNG
ncbi:hypothetical protein M3484_03765 [Pseudomonas sp. GX19020]|uniref:hypothetical protein n=1 Tax=Pseudomonas sp. GX19020 TaxID=2942277 RepID=UPI0020191629|nr:hypothetical protein [Pseudomonas sp. GX19020]MCL4065685.1 hypothetical protein [Pseudomonas sp. GX19020]